MKKACLVLCLSAFGATAQDSISLQDAVRLAVLHHQSIAASAAAAKASQARVAEAKGALLPKVDYSESWTRSDNPVFVFGSLLTQHQFGAANFQLGPLNRPGFLNDFQSRVTADQVLYDAGRANRAVASARIAQNLTAEQGRHTRMEAIAEVVRAYYDSLLGEKQLAATAQAQRSAEADLKRAESIRDAGMSTDVDVLSIRVHLAEVQERRIRSQADWDVSRAALNDALGLPLDTLHRLASPLIPLAADDPPVADRELAAVEQRPEARQAKLMTGLAETRAAAARADRKPRVALHAAFEADRQGFIAPGGGNWLVSVDLRWNLFDGFASSARIEESRFSAARASAEAQRTNSAIRLQVRRAAADRNAATQRIAVTQASVAEADESLRITQNRYRAGLANVTDLLRTETAALDARTRQLAAIRDQRVAAALLELASGSLTEDSPAVMDPAVMDPAVMDPAVTDKVVTEKNR